MRQLWTNRFYTNSFFLILSNVFAALLGFIFWIVAARFYSAEEVGLASALISAIGLLATLSSIGLPEGLIRFLPDSGKDARQVINTVLSIIFLASIIIGFVFVLGLNFWSPRLIFIRQHILHTTVFILLTVLFAISAPVDSIYIAERRAKFVLVRSLAFNALKLVLVIAVASISDSNGIIASWGISLMVSFVVGILLVIRYVNHAYTPAISIKRDVLSRLLPFSLTNYFSSLLWSGSIMLLPVIVVNILGAESNAYFFAAWSISTVLTMIPNSISTSLFAEGSNNQASLNTNMVRSLKLVILLLLPSVIAIFFLSNWLLNIFSEDYSINSVTLLRILAFTAFPFSINVIYLNMMRIEKRLGAILMISGFLAVISITLSYILLPRIGINGAGYAWLIGHSSVALYVVVSFVWKRIHSVTIIQKQ